MNQVTIEVLEKTPLTHDSFEEKYTKKYTHKVITWYMWHQDNGAPP